MTGYWQSDAHKVVAAMKAGGNSPGLVARWKDEIAAWALVNTGADSDAIKAWLPLWQTRPAYCVVELAPLWPMLVLAICGTVPRTPAANRLANELKFARLPYRNISDTEYFIVERLHYWRDAPQEEFERAILGPGNLGAMCGDQRL